jgi:hypothetical protein
VTQEEFMEVNLLIPFKAANTDFDYATCPFCGNEFASQTFCDRCEMEFFPEALFIELDLETPVRKERD